MPNVALGYKRLASMDYPPQFSETALAALVAVSIRAKDAHRDRKRKGNSSDSSRLFSEDESLKECILQVFAIYGNEVIELGRKRVWKIEDLRDKALEGLRRITIDICYEILGHSRFLESGTGSLTEETRLGFENSTQWREFESHLLEVANSKLTGTTSLGGETAAKKRSDWREPHKKFLKGALEYPEMSALWEPAAENWKFLNETSESERLFTETARLAIHLVRQSKVRSASAGETPLRKPWHAWLDLMCENQYGFQLARRQRRGWRQVIRSNELSWLNGESLPSRIGNDLSGITQVFRESAEFLEELMTDEEGLPLQPANAIAASGEEASTPAAQGESINTQNDDVVSLGVIVNRRQRMLSEYKEATGNPSNRRIYTAKNSSIHKPEFYDWLSGKLAVESQTTVNFERFLAEKKMPVPRVPTT